jgi:hypothetical protein
MGNPDYIRLNLERVSDLGDMLVAKSKEFYDTEISNLKINLRFDTVSNYHGSPLNEETNWGGYKKHIPTGYNGWIGSISCLVKTNQNPYCRIGHLTDADQHLFGYKGFRGFHTGSGCPGHKFGKCPMNIGFYFFMDDFPLLKSRYDKWKILSSFEKNKSWENSNLNYEQGL